VPSTEGRAASGLYSFKSVNAGQARAKKIVTHPITQSGQLIGRCDCAPELSAGFKIVGTAKKRADPAVL
jgi:hypothetical protein